MTKVAIISGSLREGSLSTAFAEGIKDLFPEGYDAELVDVNLPLYNEDLDAEGAETPQEWVDFREAMRDAEAVVFVTPEYNRSLPATIKNALDVGSRPYGESIWEGMAALVVSQSPGAIGGFGANHHLRQSLVFLDVTPVQQPEIYLSGSNEYINEDGSIVEDTASFIQTGVDALVDLHKQLKA